MTDCYTALPAAGAVSGEPVAYIQHHKAGDNLVWDHPGGKFTPLYAHPTEDAKDAESPLPAAELARRLTAMTTWLEANQPDVFKRGIWDAISGEAKNG